MSAQPNAKVVGSTLSSGWPIWAVLFLAGVAAVVSVFAAKPNAGFKDAAAVLALVSAAAIAIERILELLWTFANETVGQWWPFSTIVKQLDSMVKELDTAASPVFEQAETAVTNAQGLNAEVKKKLLGDLGSQKKALSEQVGELKKLAPTNQRIELLTTVAFQGISRAQKTYEQYGPEVKVAAEAAHQALTGTADFLATLKDNPGRRILSIYGGVVLGLVVAGFTGIDLFGAALATDPGKPTGTLVGVILTGFVIGLGAGPTHTVIGVLQEIRKARRLESLAAPSTDGDGGGGGNVSVAIERGAGTPSFASYARLRGYKFEPAFYQEMDIGTAGEREAAAATEAESSTKPAPTVLGADILVVSTGRPTNRPHTFMLRR